MIMTTVLTGDVGTFSRVHLARSAGRAPGRPEEIPGAQRVELRGVRAEQDVRGGDRVAHVRVRGRKLADHVRPVLSVRSTGTVGHVRPADRGRRPVRCGQHTQVRRRV